MTYCDQRWQCPFFNDEITVTHPAATDLKTRYCEGVGFRACARYIIRKKLGKEKIQENLLPNQQNRLNEILGFL